eukprot:gene649-1252_t
MEFKIGYYLLKFSATHLVDLEFLDDIVGGCLASSAWRAITRLFRFWEANHIRKENKPQIWKMSILNLVIGMYKSIGFRLSFQTNKPPTSIDTSPANYLSQVIDFYSFFGVVFIPTGLIGGHFLAQRYYENIQLKNYDTIVLSSMYSNGFKYMLVAEMTIAILLLLDVFIYHLSKMRNMFTTKGSLINISVLLALLTASGTGTFLRIATMAQYDTNSSTTGVLGVCSMVGQVSCSATLGITCLRWYYHLYKESRRREITDDEWNCTIYVTLGMTTIFIIYILLSVFGAPMLKDFTESILVAVEVAFTSFAVAQAFHQTHVIRKQSVKYQKDTECVSGIYGVTQRRESVRSIQSNALATCQMMSRKSHDHGNGNGNGNGHDAYTTTTNQITFHVNDNFHSIRSPSLSLSLSIGEDEKSGEGDIVHDRNNNNNDCDESIGTMKS